jgi:subfamily B ATP-binding cassette protein MsbA
MFRYWIFVVGGLVTMLLYAAMNGISITMIVPVLDVVFKPRLVTPHITELSVLYSTLSHRISGFLSNELNIWDFGSVNASGLLSDIKAILSDTDPFTVLWGISILVVMMFLLKNIFFYSNKYMFTSLRGRTVRDLRILMFGKYLSQSLAFFNTNRIGDSLVRMDNDVYIVSNEFISNLFLALRDVFVMISCMLVAYFMNPRLFLISLLVTPIFAISISFIGKKIKKYAKRIQTQYSNMFSQVEEALSSMRIVKAFAREDFEHQTYKAINEKYRILWQKVEMYNALNMPISEMSSAFIGVVLLMVAGADVINSKGDFTLGQFTAFLIAIFATLHPLKTLTKAYADIKRALVSLDRISYVINLETEIHEATNPIGKKSFDRQIRFEQVGFQYNRTKTVLSDISFVINKGEKTAIIGGSGSGKTTLVNLLNRMYDYTQGTIYIDDVPIRDLKIKDLRALFGVVPQESILFSNTVRYNIQYGNADKLSLESIKHAAETAYADEFIEHLPDKYEHTLSTKGSDLSGGQKQRLCIARAIAANPPILIFDEATSSLDTESEKKVQDAIDRATMNRTVVVIAHRLSTVLSSDKIVVLDKGRIVGIGNHTELIETCPRYQQLYNLQFNPENE